MIGAWALFTGVTQNLAARRPEVPGDERSTMSTIGAIAAVVGLVLIVWPGSGVVVIGWVIAIAALALAALLITLALRLKRVKERMDARDLDPTG